MSTYAASHTPPGGEGDRIPLRDLGATDAGKALAKMGWRLRPLSEVDSKAVEIAWTWEGFIARGATSLLISEPRIGKTTLVAHLLAAMTSPAGGTLLGRAVASGSAIVLTEESNRDGLWKVRGEELGIDEGRVFVECPWVGGKPTLAEWRESFRHLAVVAPAAGVSLVVVDTCNAFLPVEDENNSVQVGEAVAALKPLTESGVAVLLLHHANKNGGGGPQRRARGSNALPASADILIQMSEDRKLITAPRNGYGEPQSTVFALEGDEVPAAGKYATLEAREPIYSAICEDMFLTRKEIQAKWVVIAPDVEVPTDATMNRDLKDLHKAGKMALQDNSNRNGGKKYRYCK